MTIGGYHGLELPIIDSLPIVGPSIWLKSGRSSLRLIIKENNILHLFLPAFICKVVPDILIECNVSHTFYSITENFELSEYPTLKDHDYLLYVDYFGLKGKYVDILNFKYGNKLIVDNTLSLKEKATFSGYWQFNSLRKYFGVPDGSCLIAPHCNHKFENIPSIVNSQINVEHLIKRFEKNPHAGRKAFNINEKALGLNCELGSQLSRSILGLVNIPHTKKRRIDNFNFLHNKLFKSNLLKIPFWDILSDTLPYTYPYLPKNSIRIEDLWKEGIYCLLLWKETTNIPLHKTTNLLSSNIIHIPIDQRYGNPEMKYILSKILKYE